MKILVTGGAGYIGSHFLKELKKDGSHDVLVVDNLCNGFEENVIFGKLVQVDLREKEEIRKVVLDFKPDLVVHFAAFISVPESVEKPLLYYENNFVGSFNLIKSCVESDVKKFIFSSTAAVYGNVSGVVSEEHSLNPINPYGNSKKMVEELLHDVKISVPDFNYIILRYFNVAGNDPELEIGNRQKKAHNLIPIILNNVKSGKNSIDIFGNDWNTPDGTCIRDYIHVTDLVRAHVEVIGLLSDSYTFNVGYGVGNSVIKVVNAAEEVCDVKIERHFVGRRAGDPSIVISNNSKIISLTKWTPEFDDLNLIVKSAWDWINR